MTRLEVPMPSFVVREVHCKTLINRVQGMPFGWSINPYRGCRHACVYCYARPTHEYLGMDGGDEFQEVIFAKMNAPEVARKDLSRQGWRREMVIVGTATDPYQQAESRYRLTRGILEAFRDFRNPVSITTKSPMVLRDLDILSDLAQHVEVRVNCTVTTMDETLWRRIEPTTAKPHKRLEALRTLREHGIRTGVFLSPVLPGLTDGEKHLEAVIAAAAEHGVETLFSQPLRLGPGITEYYVPFLQREFPDLVERYERLYRRNSPPGQYSEMVQSRVRELKRVYGFADAPTPYKERPPVPPLPVQLSIFGAR